MPTLVDIERLQTVHNYSKTYTTKSGKVGVSVGYIYRLIDKQKLEAVTIDGMRFIVLPEQPPQ
jgi:hypothetical protein